MKIEESMGDGETSVHGENTMTKLPCHKTSGNLLTRKLFERCHGGANMGKTFPRFGWRVRRVTRISFTGRVL